MSSRLADDTVAAFATSTTRRTAYHRSTSSTSPSASSPSIRSLSSFSSVSSLEGRVDEEGVTHGGTGSMRSIVSADPVDLHQRHLHRPADVGDSDLTDMGAARPFSYPDIDRHPTIPRSSSLKGVLSRWLTPSSSSRRRSKSSSLTASHSHNQSDDPDDKLSLYDILIALSFFICVVLFVRALAGSGTFSESRPAVSSHQQSHSDHDDASPEITTGRWQKHNAYASSRARLHEKAGIHTRETCHDEDPGTARGWHREGVHADPHAHVSVDPEGHFSYGFHHDHDHELDHNYETLRLPELTMSWAWPRFLARGTGDGAASGDVSTTGANSARQASSDAADFITPFVEPAEEEQTSLPTPFVDDIQDEIRNNEYNYDPLAKHDFDSSDPASNYPVRVHVGGRGPSGATELGTTGRSRHRKIRNRFE